MFKAMAAGFIGSHIAICFAMLDMFWFLPPTEPVERALGLCFMAICSIMAGITAKE
jgi:hypothetical protein